MDRFRTSVVVGGLGVVYASLMGGCAGGGRVELAAADSIEVVARSLSVALKEYRHDLSGADDVRERAAVSALLTRLEGSEDDAASQRDADEFLAVLARLRADREVAWERHAVSMTNIDVLWEVASGLRRLAVDSMSLDDEARRYTDGLLRRLVSGRVTLGRSGTE